jgi:hypothetical protein
MKVFCAAFMCLKFGFVIYWQKDFGTKAAHKMLVKLTPGCLISVMNAPLFVPSKPCLLFESVAGACQITIRHARAKHSSLFVPNVSDEEKKFYNIGTWILIVFITDPQDIQLACLSLASFYRLVC